MKPEEAKAISLILKEVKQTSQCIQSISIEFKLIDVPGHEPEIKPMIEIKYFDNN